MFVSYFFAFETVLSSRYKLDILEKAKSEGYFIKCIFMLTTDASVNVTRVAARVAIGGHNVDEDIYFNFDFPHRT